ncbi:MAG: LLM class flavin-dependent oxidoreductase, partial [Candidatus Binataceae bacterium]
MHIMTFSERPYFEVPEDDIIGNGSSYFGLSNTAFDPVRGGQLYNEYFDERVYAEELGFDGVMLNEHHQTPFCMGSVMDVEAAVLARITKRVK